MYFSPYDLKQLDADVIERLPEGQVRTLAKNLLSDLKTATDRLNRNPQNSSQPPSTQPPWEKAPSLKADGEVKDQEEEADRLVAKKQQGVDDKKLLEPEKTSLIAESAADSQPIANLEPKKRSPGKQPGAPGVGRTQQLPIDAEYLHAPEQCSVCGALLQNDLPSKAYTARYEIDLEVNVNGTHGLRVLQTKHTYYDRQCNCGHWNRAEPGRSEPEEGWKVELTEWHLVGPMLVSFICFLSLRMRLSRTKVQEFLIDWFGLYLGTATINQCIHEAGRALSPVVEREIVDAIREANVVNVDETSWPQGKELLWLWVFSCVSATLFVVGKRTRELVLRVLGESFSNWLMSDGYSVYRVFDQRLRCFAHIIRKARGLAQSTDRRAIEFGKQVLELFQAIVQAVHAARKDSTGPPLTELFYARMQALLKECERCAESAHEKTAALARELLNDWNTFWVVLEYPELPLTNNDAEQSLRHWVIARLISHGTRTEEGSHAFSILASVIETCRKRAASPWHYIAEVVKLRRKGLVAPALPCVVVN